MIHYCVCYRMQKEPDMMTGSNRYIMLFMDDTVMFATSKEKLVSKLTKLKQTSDNLGMVIHPTKSHMYTGMCEWRRQKLYT